MKKMLLSALLFAAALFTGGNAYSQISFNHSIGGGLYIADAGGWAFLYSPRLNVVELADEMTVSVGTHLGLGFSGSANSRTGGDGSFLLDAPIMAEFNFGHAANPDATSSSFGGFA